MDNEMTIAEVSSYDDVFFEKEFNHSLSAEEKRSVTKAFEKRFEVYDELSIKFRQAPHRCVHTGELFKS